jgi:hypothetical protein
MKFILDRLPSWRIVFGFYNFIMFDLLILYLEIYHHFERIQSSTIILAGTSNSLRRLNDLTRFDSRLPAGSNYDINPVSRSA